MAIFNKRRDPIAAAEHTLAALQERRTRLDAKRTEAQASLDAALADQRRHFLEADLDTGAAPKNEAAQHRAAIDVLADALAEIDGKIAASESMLAAERDRAARETEAKLREEHGRVLDEAIAAYRVAGQALADALRAVTGITATANMFAQNIQTLTGEFASAAEAEAHGVRGYIAGVLAGACPIVGQPAPPVPVPVRPTLDRRQVFLLGDLKWKEYDEVKTGPKFGTWDLPIDVAARAIEHGWAVLPDSALADHLRATGDALGNWAAPLPQNCIDLDAEKITLPPPGSYGHGRIAEHLRSVAA